eukprot:TRINITY_DN9507_c0_g2_i1.p1 TRINITY_DN9507_c0_g2~~TRINITY_DN9507_c0_g2_i1.p1  ORF type:complete len:352 (+),score=57.93 TRINITY_DN9507_c0_g2_i1:34-1056(+)
MLRAPRPFLNLARWLDVGPVVCADVPFLTPRRCNAFGRCRRHGSAGASGYPAQRRTRCRYFCSEGGGRDEGASLIGGKAPREELNIAVWQRAQATVDAARDILARSPSDDGSSSSSSSSSSSGSSRGASFLDHKARVLRRTLLEDRSPKASVDPRVVDILDQLNARPEFATTSSCSGRVLFVSYAAQHGANLSNGKNEVVVPGVRNVVGRWRVSHDEISDAKAYFSLDTDPLREPRNKDHLWLMVQPFDLHVACATADDANRLLALAQRVFPGSSIIAPARDWRTVVSIHGNQRLEMLFSHFGHPVYCGSLQALADIINGKLQKNWSSMDRLLEMLRMKL